MKPKRTEKTRTPSLTDAERDAVIRTQRENCHTHGLKYLCCRLQDATVAAEKATEEILPDIGDTNAHPLPSLESLRATPPKWEQKTTLGELSEKLYEQLRTEHVAKARYGADRLETFFECWLIFMNEASKLVCKKIDAAQAAGQKSIAVKLANALKKLPSGNCENDNALSATIKHLSDTVTPDQFHHAFRTALKLDAEATAEINTPSQRDNPVVLLKEIKETTLELRDNKRAKGKKDRANGAKQARHLREWNTEHTNAKQVAELKLVTKQDEKDYPDISTPRPHGYWKNLWQSAPSFPSFDALRKAVMRKRAESRGKYPREGKKRGPYKKRV